jgi:hypothetical protein
MHHVDYKVDIIIQTSFHTSYLNYRMYMYYKCPCNKLPSRCSAVLNNNLCDFGISLDVT